jgi:hypothetical protein
MKFLIFPILSALAISLPVHADQFSIPEGGVTFNAPDGFTLLSKEEISLKYPTSRPPSLVVGNKARTTTIAYDLKPESIPPDKLPEVKAAFEKLFERIIPKIVWKERVIKNLENQQWIYLEFTSQAIDTRIHNIMLITPLRGKMLVFNFNSTKEEFPIIESKLRKSLNSIKLLGSSFQ